MELGPARDGNACGFGCCTLGALALAAVVAREFDAVAEAALPGRVLLSSIPTGGGRRRHWAGWTTNFVVVFAKRPPNDTV